MMRKKNIISVQGESSGGRQGEFSNVVNVKNKKKGIKYGAFRYARGGMAWGGEATRDNDTLGACCEIGMQPAQWRWQYF